jgi:hypothetical protein
MTRLADQSEDQYNRDGQRQDGDKQQRPLKGESGTVPTSRARFRIRWSVSLTGLMACL